MTTRNPRPQDFAWASEKDANLKEPLQGIFFKFHGSRAIMVGS